MSVESNIEQLVDAGLLTERQAQAFILRDIETVPRQGAADYMGVSMNVVDKHLRAARDKVGEAWATVEAIEEIRSEDLPERCGECGTTLGGQWSEGEEGRALCLSCAGVTAE